MPWSAKRPVGRFVVAGALGAAAIAMLACTGGDGTSAMPRSPIAGAGAGGAGLSSSGNTQIASGTGGAPVGGRAGSTAGRSGAAGTAGAGGMAAGGSNGSAGSSGSGAMAGAAATAGAGGAQPPMMSSGCGVTGAKTGQLQAEIMAADLMRGYFLSVPADYDANKPYRLVFGYHGSNYTGRMMRQYLDNEKAPLLAGTIFVYPGLPLPNQPDNIAWVLTEGGRDLVFFDTLLAELKSKYCIDEKRIFVNGQSYGGLMTNAVGCLRGNVVRAIAVVAGSGPRSTCKGPIAVWLTHGTDDMNVPFSSGEQSRDKWVANNHCMNMTEPGTPMQCLNYVGCDAGYPVIWCPHTADGGHQHPSFGRAAVREFLASF